MKHLIALFLFSVFTVSAFGQAASAQYQQAAVQQFPELAIEGSPFHKAFIQAFASARAANDPVLNSPEWPLILAQRVAASMPNPQTAGREGRSTALDEPDRLRNANEGHGVRSGNPLDRPAQRDPKTIKFEVVQSMQGQLLIEYKGELALITNIPPDFMVKEGTRMKCKVNPTPKLTQYTTVLGATNTVDAYAAVETPKPQ